MGLRDAFVSNKQFRERKGVTTNNVCKNCKLQKINRWALFFIDYMIKILYLPLCRCY